MGLLLAVGMGNREITPAVVMRPMLLAPGIVNHRAPSGPAVIPNGPTSAGIGNSVITPVVVMRPMLLAVLSANQRAPSGPAAMHPVSLDAVGIGNSVTTPAVVMRPILLPLPGVSVYASVNRSEEHTS